jgi:threonine dehydrogenase-like Zn-dependent dehydrogenase
MAAGQVDTASLITHRFALEEWEEALEVAGQHGTKVLFEIASPSARE